MTLAFAWHMLSLTTSEAKWEGNWRVFLSYIISCFLQACGCWLCGCESLVIPVCRNKKPLSWAWALIDGERTPDQRQRVRTMLVLRWQPYQILWIPCYPLTICTQTHTLILWIVTFYFVQYFVWSWRCVNSNNMSMVGRSRGRDVDIRESPWPVRGGAAQLAAGCGSAA